MNRIFITVEPMFDDSVSFCIYSQEEIEQGMIENDCDEGEFLSGELDTSMGTWIEMGNTKKNRDTLKALWDKMEELK